MSCITDKAVFLHVPKTAGRWVTEKGLAAAGVTSRRDGWHTVPELNGRRAFCFVRHPVTWYRSYWLHRQRTSFNEFDRMTEAWWGLRLRRLTVGVPFAEFVDNMLELFPPTGREPGAFAHRMFSRFTGFCAYVGRFEDLPEALSAALLHCGHSLVNADGVRKAGAQRINETPAEQDPAFDWWDQANAALAERICQAESGICRRYGYEVGQLVTRSLS